VDDKRTEEMLRESWQPQPPDGMRERVLGRSREEPAPRRAWFAFSWRTAFAAVGILIICLSFISDSARQSRLAALETREPAGKCALMAAQPVTMAEWRAELLRPTERPSEGTR
jgi:hypothetical protein